MKKIAITGLSGVIGGVLLPQLLNEFEITDLYRSNKNKNKKIKSKRVDLLDIKNIEKSLYESEPDLIIHLASVTHIDKCEIDKKNGKNGIVWKTNVDSTEEIAKFAEKNRIPLIFLSSECVFDGKLERYAEKNKKNPINWYGVTKSEAEEIVLGASSSNSVVRSVVAYHPNDRRKTIHGKLLYQLKKMEEIRVANDQKFSPTFTNDIARGIKQIIKKELKGIYHIAPNSIITPYDLAHLIAKKNKKVSARIIKASLIELYGDERARLRLLNSVLDSAKSSKKLGFRALNPDEVIL